MVESGVVVTLDFVLRDQDGQVLDSSETDGNLVYLHGYGQLLSGMEKALEGHQAGDFVKARLLPEEAYGKYDDSLRETIKRRELSEVEPLEEGQILQREMGEEVQWMTILSLNDEEVVLDTNHPLAGHSIDFEAKILSVREADSEELEHGHVHHHSHEGGENE